MILFEAVQTVFGIIFGAPKQPPDGFASLKKMQNMASIELWFVFFDQFLRIKHSLSQAAQLRRHFFREN